MGDYRSSDKYFDGTVTPYNRHIKTRYNKESIHCIAVLLFLLNETASKVY